MRLAENKVENISDGLILSHPKYGWATVNLNGFKGRVSYLNDIAFDWLKALKVAIENKTVATLYGDEEGSYFYIVLDNYYGFESGISGKDAYHHGRLSRRKKHCDLSGIH